MEEVAQKGRLFIPACGDRLKLTEPWRFTLILERRNTKFAKALGLIEQDKGCVYTGQPYRSPLKSTKAELPAGTVIECDRVYIRQYNKGRIQDANDYDSITWKAMTAAQAEKSKPKLIGRFWVKLPDCYTVEYEMSWDALYRDRVKLVDQVHDL